MKSCGSKKSSTRQILKASAIMGGSSAVSMLAGIIRTKVMAVLLGPEGIGLLGLFQSLLNTAGTITGMGLATSGVRQVAEAQADGDATRLARTRSALCWAVGIRGVPVIGLQNSQAPLFSCVDISINGLGTHVSSLVEYIALVENMIASSTLRKEKGAQIECSIRAAHLPPVWNNYLRDIILSLPAKHTVTQLDVSSSTMDSGDNFLAGFDAINAPNYKLNTPISFQMRNFPVHERARLILNGLLGNDMGLISPKDCVLLLSKRLKWLLGY